MVGQPDRGSLPTWLALAGAVLVGTLTAVQARVNGQLGLQLGDGVAAAAISFVSGFVILIVLSAALPAGRRGFSTLVHGIRTRSVPWWMLIAGAAGALTTATQGLAVGVIGVSMFTVGVVAGQTLCGLVLDRAGYGPAGVVAVTMPRVAGGALALLAVVVSLSTSDVETSATWMLVLPFLAGAGIAWQQATNGRLRQRVGTALTATLVNFAGGSAILAVAASVVIVVSGPSRPWPAEAWLYLGGPLGVVYIFLSAALVSVTGVLLLGLGSVVGLLLTSLALDVVWPAESSPGFASEVTMVLIALASVVVATVRWRTPRR